MAKIKNEPIVFLTIKMWQFAKGRHMQMILSFIMFIISSILFFLGPLILAKIINIIQLEGIVESNIKTLLLTVMLFLALEFTFWIFHGNARIMENLNAFYVKINYKNYLMNGILDLSAKWHTDSHSGDIIDKVNKSTDALFDFSSSTFVIISSIVKLISSYFAIMYFNFHASYIVAIIFILTIMTILQFDKRLKKQYLKLYRYDNTISAKVFDIISNITTVIILRIEKLVSKDILKTMYKPEKLFKKQNRLNELKWFTVSMFASLLTVLVLGSYIYFSYINQEIILVGTISALFMYVSRINGVFYDFAWRYEIIVKNKTAVDNVQDIVKEFVLQDPSKNIKLSKTWKNIYIKNLNFSYNEEHKNNGQLRDIHFTINRKEKIAIIGESGGGKTTFLKLLRGLYKPNSGKILIDNVLNNEALTRINNVSMLIPQEPEIFATTIKENITLGINHSIKTITKFTDLACFTNVVKRLPNGLDSSIVEKGVNLSGGEKQRLALSRALLFAKSKEIVLMDESTSSVDPTNELKIYKSVFKEFKSKTIICSIHKLNLLHLFDRIVMFKNGKIVASGKLADLLKDNKDFQKMWEKYSK